MKLSMGKTTKKQELNIIGRFIEENPLDNIKTVCTAEDIIDLRNMVKKIFVHDCVREYIVDIIMKSRKSEKAAYGASTRGTLALLRCSQAYSAISGQKYVTPDTVKQLAPYVLGHRIQSDSGYGYGYGDNEAIREMIEQVDVPVENWEI